MDDLETCGKCMGSGYGGHPDSGAVCADCNGAGCVRADLCADPALLAEAVEVLRYLLDDIQDYQRINNLGGENNHSQVRARAFIAKLENRHDR